MYSPHLPASPCVLGEKGRGSHPLLSETIRHAPKSDRNRCRACSSMLVRFKTLRCVRHTVVPSTVRGRDQPAKTRESGTLHDASPACAVCKYAFHLVSNPTARCQGPNGLAGLSYVFFLSFLLTPCRWPQSPLRELAAWDAETSRKMQLGQPPILT